VLVEALQRTHRVAVGTFTWRGKSTPIAIRVHGDGLLLQRLYFADEVQNAAEIDQGAEPKIRVLKAIEQKMAGQRSSASKSKLGRRRLTWSRHSRRASDGRNWRRRLLPRWRRSHP
jgi:non-homologous end joining protein Ku